MYRKPSGHRTQSAGLNKGLVFTRLSRLNKIILREQGNDQCLIMAVARRPHCE